jgi:NAD(P)-dependent dehydrogenase (short-subunit alcohol dehydrogenase family)
VNLKGKRALITSNSIGIGLALAHALLDKSAKAVIKAVEPPPFQMRSEDLRRATITE